MISNLTLIYAAIIVVVVLILLFNTVIVVGGRSIAMLERGGSAKKCPRDELSL